jgi:hypothetical protein
MHLRLSIFNSTETWKAVPFKSILPRMVWPTSSSGATPAGERTCIAVRKAAFLAPAKSPWCRGLKDLKEPRDLKGPEEIPKTLLIGARAVARVGASASANGTQRPVHYGGKQTTGVAPKVFLPKVFVGHHVPTANGQSWSARLPPFPGLPGHCFLVCFSLVCVLRQGALSRTGLIVC